MNATVASLSWSAIAKIVLGSSLLATGMQIAADYWWLEPRKLDLVAQETIRQEKRGAYGLLAKDLEKLSADVETAVLVFQKAIDDPKDSAFRRHIDRQVTIVTDQMAQTLRTASTHLVEETIRKRAGEILDSIGVALASAQQDRKRLSELIQLHQTSTMSALATLIKDVYDFRASVGR